MTQSAPKVVVLTWTNNLGYDGIEITRRVDDRDEVLEASLDGTAETYTDSDHSLQGLVTYTVVPTHGTCDPATVEIDVLRPESTFLRDDGNADGDINISDGISILSFLFTGGETPSCKDAADVNADNDINISDGIYVLASLFTGGPPPPAPFPECGTSPYSLAERAPREVNNLGRVSKRLASCP